MKILVGMMTMAAGYAAALPTFSTPKLITDDGAPYQLSRNPEGCLAIDASDTLSLVYWSGSGSSVTPTNASRVYYRSWKETTGWSDQVSIDDSEISNQHIGGRHPSVTIDSRGDVWAMWHDHRNGTAGANYVDNVEIYADRKPEGGAFSPTDQRITDSNAGGAGDNGYAPQVVTTDDGRVAVIWYDYFGDDTSSGEDLADLYLRVSDATGTFDPADTMTSMRLTNQADRSGTPSYTLPDMEVGGDGNFYAVWVGGQGPTSDLLVGQIDTTTMSIDVKQTVSGVASFFDPPRITRGSSGDLWIAYSSLSGASRVISLAHIEVQPTFSMTTEVLANDAGDDTSPSIAAGSDGVVRVAWVNAGSSRKVYYGEYTPGSPSDFVYTPLEGSGSYQRTSIALDSQNTPLIIYEELIDSTQGRIWFVGPPPTSTFDTWMSYQ